MYKDELTNGILLAMVPHLSSEQIDLLKDTLYLKMYDYSIDKMETALSTYDDTNEYIIQIFLQSKLATNQNSSKTIRQYKNRLENFFLVVNKNYSLITTNDIRVYLAKERMRDGHQKKTSTMLNIQNVLSSFFKWLSENEYIEKNPMAKVEKYKVAKVIRKPFSEEEVTSMKDACDNIRDLAMIDLLDSSAIRCGELVSLNRNDLEFNGREFYVVGKGNKERITFFNADSSIHIKQYLNTRTDDNPALFVSSKAPHSRLSVSGVEKIIHKIADTAHVEDAHPHRFRRTVATRMLKSGVPINAIQVMLGHSNISTTQIYAQIDTSEVKHFYNKVYN